MEDVRIPANGVVLRPHHEPDIDRVLEQCRDPLTQQWTTVPSPYTRAHAEQFVRERVVEGWRRADYLALAVADPASDVFLGTVDLRPDGQGAAEIGFGLHPDARGRGVMTAAVRAVAGWAFCERSTGGLGLEVLFWRAQVGNWPSRRVAWRSGFHIEGRVRLLHAARSRRYDSWLGSLMPEDPREPTLPWYDVPTLHSDHCVLRPMRTSDVGAVVEACSDPVTRRFIATLPAPYTASDALAYIQSREEEHASGRGIYWAVADPVSDRCIGAYAMMSVDRVNGTAELGYWIHPDARGRGVATAATRLAVRHAAIPEEDGGLGLRRLVLYAAASNVASHKVAERAGFVPFSRARAAERLGDGSYDDLIGFELSNPVFLG